MQVIDESITKEIINLVRSMLKSGMRFCLPAQIISFDPKKQTCQVQPLIKDEKVYSDGTVEAIQLPVLADVPLLIQSGGGCFQTFPILGGEECLLVFSDSSIEHWFVDGTMTAPRSKRSHRLCDAFAIVGINNQKKVITNYNNEAPEFRTKDDKIKITYGADGTLTMVASKLVVSGDVEIQGATTLDKDVIVKGKITADQDIASNNGDVRSGSVSLKNHQHLPGTYTAPSGGGPVTGDSGPAAS